MSRHGVNQDGAKRPHGAGKTDMSCGRIKEREKFVTPRGRARIRIPRERSFSFYLSLSRADVPSTRTLPTFLCKFTRVGLFAEAQPRDPKVPSRLDRRRLRRRRSRLERRDLPFEILRGLCHRTYSFCIKVNKTTAWALSTSLFRSSDSSSSDGRVENGAGRRRRWRLYRCLM